MRSQQAKAATWLHFDESTRRPATPLPPNSTSIDGYFNVIAQKIGIIWGATFVFFDEHEDDDNDYDENGGDGENATMIWHRMKTIIIQRCPLLVNKVNMIFT